MALASGTRLGPYEIAAQIGVGVGLSPWALGIGGRGQDWTAATTKRLLKGTGHGKTDHPS